MRPILTAIVGTSADVFSQIARLYLVRNCSVADVTYGRGVFWKNLAEGKYNLFKSDLERGVDFRDLPYDDESMDAVVLDPPYMARGGGFQRGGTGRRYRNVERDQHAVLKDYIAGAREARRVLKKGGVLILKCQDGVEHAKQHWMHCWIMHALEQRGYEIVDLFIQVQKGTPPMRHKHQRHARKNHSYFIVARKVRRGRH